MKIMGGIRYTEKGLTASLRAMHVESSIVTMHSENMVGFDKVGYQRKDPVVSSFTEYIGVHGLSQTVDDKIGRIQMSDSPLDIALAGKGYFTVQNADGVELTRDGRFKLDKEGNLLSLTDGAVLSNTGMPIKLPFVPDDVKEISVNSKGLLSVFNKKTGKLEKVAYLGVMDSNGVVTLDPQVKQGYNEYSNVSMQEEAILLSPALRNFEANRQMFMLQNQNLQKVIAQLGSAQ